MVVQKVPTTVEDLTEVVRDKEMNASPPQCIEIWAYCGQKTPMNRKEAPSIPMEALQQSEEHFEARATRQTHSVGAVEGPQHMIIPLSGSDEGIVIGPQMLIPLSGSDEGTTIEWEGRNLFGEEKMGTPSNSQWASREGEPIPLNCMPPY